MKPLMTFFAVAVLGIILTSVVGGKGKPGVSSPPDALKRASQVPVSVPPELSTSVRLWLT